MNNIKKILVVNGPNLNLLGIREPDLYGAITLKEIEDSCMKVADQYGVFISFFQSNSESEIIDAIHLAEEELYTDIIINAAAYSHTSIAIMDALKILNANIYEVHLSNIYRREEFRQNSYVSKVAKGVISGFGADGYIMAVQYICNV